MVVAIPINTSPQTKQYQCNNQPQPELSATYLDESRKIDLILLVLQFGWLFTIGGEDHILE
jgi:hypothetical protein